MFQALPLGGGEAAKLLEDGGLDAAFYIVGSSASVVQDLLRAPGIRLLAIDRAAAYALKHPFLQRLVLPEGAIDLALDRPPSDTPLLAGAANLVVRADFHPALEELLLSEARIIHGDAGVLEAAGQFPTRQYLEFPIADEARRFFTAGPSLLQRYLPFWVATFIDRTIILLLPLVALVYPFFKFIPPVYNWRMNSRINRWYRELQKIEALVEAGTPRDELAHRLARLDRIERNVQALTMPVAFGNQLYSLRAAIALLRDELRAAAARDPTG